MNLIFLGAPGAGKGTQAETVQAKLNIPAISTGNILREAVKDGTDAGKTAEGFMKSGGLVPDEVVINILKDRIAKDDCKAGFILDGFPRTVAQADALTAFGVKIDKVINIDVADNAIAARMGGRRVCNKCGASYHTEYKPSKVDGKCDGCGGDTVIRDDDKPETVLERLKTYHEKTAPLIGYYESKGILATVKGQSEIKETTALVFSALGI
ncbi:MAG: adenylate kinase [Oscillospiraceae bacterium]|jgi:adenylate kinase|nr:adenylate kinase [Oscillospiraceae bacterium]